MKTVGSNNIFKNNGKSSNKISLRVYDGVLSGNIIEEEKAPEPTIVITCEENALDFTCPENSQYLPII